MKAILPIAVFLLVVGIAAAVNVEAPINLTITGIGPVSYEQLAGFNLIVGTPAFSAGWANVSASATAPESLSKNLTAIATINIMEPTGGVNIIRRDPIADLNMTSISLSGISNGNVSLSELNDHGFGTLALASGAIDTHVQAAHNAWTAGQLEVHTDASLSDIEGGMDTATATISGGAAAIADHFVI